MQNKTVLAFLDDVYEDLEACGLLISTLFWAVSECLSHFNQARLTL